MSSSPAGRWDRATISLLTGFFAGSAGAAALVTALGKQTYDLTGRELDLGLLGLAEFAPAAFLVLVTGTVADRYARRRVASVAALGEAVVTLAITGYVASSPTAVGPLFGLALALGVARAFVAPASRSLPADMVSSDHLPWLVARWTIVFQLALITGPVLAGSLYAVDVRAPFAASTALFLLAAVAFGLLPPPSVPTANPPATTGDTSPLPVPPAAATAGDPEPRSSATAGTATGGHAQPPASAAAGTGPRGHPQPSGSSAATGASPTTAPGAEHSAPGTVAAGEPAEATRPAGLHQALEGLRIVWRQPILLGAISLDLFAVLFGGAVALLPAIAEERLGVGPVGFGWLRAAPGIGAALVMVLLAIRPVRRRVGRRLLAAVAVFGLATVVLGVTHSYPVAFAALVVLAGADAFSVFIRVTLVPLITPPAARGRVLAVENVFIGASNELGAFESGVTGQLLGAGPAVTLGGVATLAVAATWSRLFPPLRDVDRFPAAVLGSETFE